MSPRKRRTRKMIRENVKVSVPAETTPAEFAALIGERVARLRDLHAEVEGLAALLEERFGIREEIPALSGT
jgi:hypothetical protein